MKAMMCRMAYFSFFVCSCSGSKGFGGEPVKIIAFENAWNQAEERKDARALSMR
jgi:hypothetical protein